MDVINSPVDAYKLLDIERYVVENGKQLQETFESHNSWDSYLGECRYFDILSGRGCVGRCTFCYRMVKGMRKHSVSYVIEHMKYLYDTYKINMFLFEDELFVDSEKWVDDFCAALKDSKMDVRFSISSRAILITEDLLEKLKSVGCVHIGVGFESGSQKMLDSMKKYTKIEHNYNAYRLLKKHSMILAAPTVQGLPGETKETLKDTLKFFNDCGVDNAAVYYATPYPNSEIYQYALKKGLIQNEDEYLEWISNSDASELKINLTQLSDVDLIYHHWILAEALRKNKIKNKLSKNELIKTDYYTFILKHYAIKMLYYTGLFKFVWNFKNAVVMKNKRKSAI